MIIELNAVVVLLFSIIVFGFVGRIFVKHFESDKKEEKDND